MMRRLSSSRGKSNPKQQQQSIPLSSKQLELEAQRTEDKLRALKQQMEAEKAKKVEVMKASGSRWKKSATTSTTTNQNQLSIQPSKSNATVASTAKDSNIKVANNNVNNASLSSTMRTTSASKMSQVPKQQMQQQQQQLQQFQITENKGQQQQQLRASSGQNTKQILLVRDILIELSLQKYADIFAAERIVTLADLQGVSADRLKTMGVALGHSIKLMKRANAFSIQPELVQQNLPQPQESTRKQSSNIPKTSIDTQLVKPVMQRNPSKTLMSASSQNNSSSKSLHDSSLTETTRASTARGRGDRIPATSKTVETTATCNTSCGTETQSLVKICCWNCYKIVSESPQVIYAFQKSFCGSACMKSYEKLYIITCTKCNQRVLKQEANLHGEQWFCFGKCEPLQFQYDPNKVQIETDPNNLQEGSENMKSRSIDADTASSLFSLGPIEGGLDGTLNSFNDAQFSLADIEAKYKVLNSQNTLFK